MNLLGRDQSCNMCIFISNSVDKHTYQNSEEYSPTFSKGKKPKSSYLKCVYNSAYNLGNKQEEY